MLIRRCSSHPPLLVLAVGGALTPTDQLFPNQGDLEPVPREGPRLRGRRGAVSRLPVRVPARRARPDGRAVPRCGRSGRSTSGPTSGCSPPGRRRSCWRPRVRARPRSCGCGGDAEADGGAAERAAAAAGSALRLVARCPSARRSRSPSGSTSSPPCSMAVARLGGARRRPAVAGVALGARRPREALPGGDPARARDPVAAAVRPARAGAARARGRRDDRVGLAPFVVLAGSESTFQFLRYNAERGLEVETIGGGLAVLGGLLTGQPDRVRLPLQLRQRRWCRRRGLAGAAARSLTVVGFGLVAWLGWRRIRPSARCCGRVRPSTIVTLATISSWCCSRPRRSTRSSTSSGSSRSSRCSAGRQFWLAAAIVALTIPIHPLLFAGLVNQEALPILVLNLAQRAAPRPAGLDAPRPDWHPLARWAGRAEGGAEARRRAD